MEEFSQSWPSKVNHTGSKNNGPESSSVGTAAGALPGWERFIIVLAMFTYAILLGLLSSYGDVLIGLLMALLAYLLGIYLYYGIARLAFTARNYLLWIGGILAFVVTYSIAGLSGMWFMLTSWSMIILGGTVVGRLSRSRQRQIKVYLTGLLIVSAFAVAQYAPQWEVLMSTLSEYGGDAMRKSLESVELVLSIAARLVPAFTVLASVTAFSVGYLIFAYRLGQSGEPGQKMIPFIRWKMPFMVTPVLIIAIVMRLLGSEKVELAADNLLVFLCLFYSVTGLALIEFYLRKFQFSTVLKILFYIVFFLSQLVGLFVAAFLGFVDSFADWRKVQQLSLEEK